MTIGRTAILGAIVGLSASALLSYHARSWKSLDRVLAFLAPLLLVLCAVETVVHVSISDRWVWNEIRLARTFGLYSGVPLYPARDFNGPILGTLHTPLSHILYWPAIFASSPVAAVRAAVCISILFVIASLAHAHIWVGGQSGKLLRAVRVVFALEFFWIAVLHTPDLSQCVFAVHADPVALACGTVAASLLYKRPVSSRRLALSALFAVLTVWSKQTFATLPIALSAFLLIADGPRTLRRYCVSLLLCTVLTAAVFVPVFSPVKSMAFNLVTLPSGRPLTTTFDASLAHRPASPSAPTGVESSLSRVTHRDFLYQNIAFVGLLLLLWWYLRDDVAAPGAPRGVAGIFSRQRWLLFLCISAAMLPVLIKASLTIGGDKNHLAVVKYFILLGFTMCLLESLQNERATRQPAWRCVSIAALLLFMVWISIGRTRHSGLGNSSTTAEAAAFARKHPGTAYFPYNPLASFYSTHRLYTMDNAIFDREVAGVPLLPGQFETGLPADQPIVAIALHQIPSKNRSPELNHYLSSGWVLSADPELPGFAVYRRASSTALGTP